MRLGQMLDVHRLEIRGSQLQYLGTQHKVTTVAGNVAELFQREQTTPRHRGGYRGTAGNLTQTQRGVIAVERANDGETLTEPAHCLTSRLAVFFSCHGASVFRYAKRSREIGRASPL